MNLVTAEYAIRYENFYKDLPQSDKDIINTLTEYKQYIYKGTNTVLVYIGNKETIFKFIIIFKYDKMNNTLSYIRSEKIGKKMKNSNYKFTDRYIIMRKYLKEEKLYRVI